jgi:hypothetical protein
MGQPHFFYNAAAPMFDRMNCAQNRVQFIRWRWLANAMKKMWGGRGEAGIDKTMLSHCQFVQIRACRAILKEERERTA